MYSFLICLLFFQGEVDCPFYLKTGRSVLLCINWNTYSKINSEECLIALKCLI